MEWTNSGMPIEHKPLLFKTKSGSIFQGYYFSEHFCLYHPIFNSGSMLAKFPKDFIDNWSYL